MRFNLLVNCILLGIVTVASVALAIPLMARDSAASSSYKSDDSISQIRGSESSDMNVHSSESVKTKITYNFSSSPDDLPSSQEHAPNLYPRGKVSLKVSFDFGKKTKKPTPAQQSTRAIVKRFILDAMRSLIRNVEFNIEFENDWIGENTEITFSVVGGQECPAEESGAGRRSLSYGRSEGEGYMDSTGGAMSKRSGSGCHGGLLDKGTSTWVLKNSMDRPIYGPVPRPNGA